MRAHRNYCGLDVHKKMIAALFPLVEPDRQISRIRLSEKTHTERIRHVTPSATSEHNLRWLDSSSIPTSFVASCVRL